MNKSELKIVLSSMETSQSRIPSSSSSNNANHSHIPVPKIPSLVKLQDNRLLHQAQQQYQNNNNNNQQHQQHNNMAKRVGESVAGRRISVAAQRASFERLQDAVNSSPTRVNKPQGLAGVNNNSCSDSHGLQLRSSFNNENRLPSSSFSSTASPASPVKRNSNETSKLNRSNSSLSSDSRWRTKYEESERMRKTLLQKSEAVNREQIELQRKLRQLQKDNDALHSQVKDKDRELHKLRTVSEAVCKEYEQLKRQYDVETGALHKAMQQASQWYKQNRELKRRSQVLVQQFVQSRPDGLPGEVDISDEVDANSDSDIEQLRETVTELSQEVARLQTELNSARLQEFEAQEQAALASAQLEEERTLRNKDEHKLRELKVHKENMERVSRMVAEEVQALKTQCDSERERAKIMKIEADRVQKERNVLAHQSALLMAEIGDDPNGRLLAVLQEVESLKRLLEEEHQEHQSQIQMLQDKLEEKEANLEFEIVEEKLKLAESELDMAVERAERAEKSVKELEEVVRSMEEKIAELQNAPAVPAAPPAPPPPPPLPPKLPSGNALASIKLATRERFNSAGNNCTAVSDMENMLGINPKKTLAVPQQPAIDDIINQIKGGRFTLKQTDKQREEEKKRRQAETAAPAVSEMLNILGTMRRRAKPIRQSFKFNDLQT